MISPHTPPGTPLIVVWIPKNIEEILTTTRPEFETLVRNVLSDGELVFPAEVGQRVTLESIQPTYFMRSGFTASIVECKSAVFALECFKIAELPRVLTELLVPELVPA